MTFRLDIWYDFTSIMSTFGEYYHLISVMYSKSMGEDGRVLSPKKD